jgi:hypothetical protein
MGINITHKLKLKRRRLYLKRVKLRERAERLAREKKK